MFKLKNNMIYNNGNKITQLGGINQAWDASQMVYQYYKPASGSPTPPPPHDYSQDYLTFEAIDSGTFAFSQAVSLYYSLDSGLTWSMIGGSFAPTPTVNAGDTIMFKGELTSPSYDGIGVFRSSGRFNAMGNPHSLLWGDNFVGQTDLTGKDYAFGNLFSGCTGLVSAENLVLPATTLSLNCYWWMFTGCTSLTTAPSVLPAMTVSNSNYHGMFAGCSSLTTAPELPATTLGIGSYALMFSGCTSLTTAPSVLPATTLYRYTYRGMFDACTSLETAPELPATTLAQECYREMFMGCTSLNYIKMLATDISASDCLRDWVYSVPSGGTFVKSASMTTLPTGNDGIPNGWTVQDNV